MVINKNYYAFLGISPQANSDEIKRAYKLKSKEWHPDRNKHPQALQMMMDINEAYEILKDPVKRENYDILYRKLFSTQLERRFSKQEDPSKIEEVERNYIEEARKHKEWVSSIKFNLGSVDDYIADKMSILDPLIENVVYWVGIILAIAFVLAFIASLFSG